MAGSDNFTWDTSSATVGIGETITVSVTYGMAPESSALTTAFNGLATAIVGSSEVEITGVAAGTVTVPAGTNVGNSVTTANAFTLTVTDPAPVEDDKFLNKRGLTHFWENIDDIKQDKLTAGANITIAADNTISASQPTVGNATLTIQKNGASAGTFTANATSNKAINITVPTTAADVSALPASTKYGASIAVSINTTDYKVTTTLKDQDGNTLGTAQVIDLPLESVVVNGSYDNTNKKIVLTLQNGNTIDIPVADLVAGLQSEITSANKLASDLVDDTNQTHKFMTSAEKTKLSGIATGAEVNVQSDWDQTTTTADDYIKNKPTLATVATSGSYNDLSNRPTIPTVNDATLTIQRNGTNVQTFTANASSNVTANISVPTKTSDLTNDGSDNTAQYLETDETAYATASIPYAKVDSTSTATEFTATVPGITQLRQGVSFWLENGVVTSASGFTVNINNLGAKPVYSNLAEATRDTTIFNVSYTMLFVYDADRVSGGAFICYRGYDANTNTIGYQLRTNSSTLPAKQTGYRYRLWLTSADGQNYVPINTATGTSTTSTKALNTDTPIDPFGTIIYCSTNGTTTAGANLPTGTQWTQYYLDLRYAKYPLTTLTFPDPVYLQCTPQSTGGALMNDIVQTLPTTEDGKIYIYLGNAYSTVSMELKQNHPVYYFKDGAIRLWTNAASSGGSTAEPFVIHVTSVDEANRTFTSTETYEEVKAAYNDGRFLTLEADMSNSSFDVTIHADLYQYISTSGTEGFTFAAYDASSDTQRVGLSKMAFDMYKDSNGPTYEYSYYRSNGTVEIDATLNQYSSHAIANSAVATALAAKADSSSLATVATSGSYNDLSNKPTIPTAGTITSGSTGYATGGDVYTVIGDVETILQTLNNGGGAQ